jgi:hypothetical protein
MTAAVRLHIRRQIDHISRERVANERVLFCDNCFEPYDKGRDHKLCACRRARKQARKVASPVAA